MLPCGHEHEIDCGLPIEKFLLEFRCSTLVENTFSCGQILSRPCYKAPVCVCKDMCKVQMECGHNCGS